jgi:hypothetical protein
MKNLIKLFVPALVIWTNSAQAEFVWAQTPLWRTFYQKQQVLKIQTQTPNLDRVCGDYEQAVVDGSGKTDLAVGDVDVLRRVSDATMDTEFKAVFKVDAAASTALMQKTVVDANAFMASNSLDEPTPFFNIALAEVSPVQNVSGTPQIVAGAGSLSQISRDLGLKPLPLQVIAQGIATTIQVHGKDTVCDLYSGRASLQIESVGTVKISLADQLASQEFYQKIEDVTKKVFAHHKSPLRRALAFGYEAGDVVYPLTKDHERTEFLIENIVSTLFDDNMQPNQLWSTFAGDLHLSVTGAADEAFHVTLEK